MKLPRLSWHAAFVGAIQLELADYRDSLEFIPEFQLTTEPLRIDCVIIKKPVDIVIKKNIAAIFREVNLIEYKSPGRNISVRDFYKVYAYAYLNTYMKKSSITSLTITFIVNSYPKKLFEHLKNTRNYSIEETSPGIYTIIGDLLPIQVIDNRKLSVDENMWLKGLRKNLEPLETIQISEAAGKLDKALIKPYFYVIAQANALAIEEAMKMRKPEVTIEEVIERSGLGAKLEAKAEARTEAKWKAREKRRTLDIARKMVAFGFPAETVVSITELDAKKVEKLYLKSP